MINGAENASSRGAAKALASVTLRGAASASLIDTHVKTVLARAGAASAEVRFEVVP